YTLRKWGSASNFRLMYFVKACTDKYGFPASILTSQFLTYRNAVFLMKNSVRLLTYYSCKHLPSAEAFSALWSVFFNNIVIVIGPTPPGTGVIAEAFSLADSKSTSPQSLPFSSRFMPTSMT